MKFRNRYSEMKTVFSNPGEVMAPIYELKVDAKGKRGIVKVGETNLQEAIDSEFASVDMNLVLKRLENGDFDVLNKVEGFYADVAALPVDIREIMEMNEKASMIFDEMPDDLRRIYGNDYMQFLYDPGKLVDEINKRNSNVDDEKVIVDDDKE